MEHRPSVQAFDFTLGRAVGVSEAITGTTVLGGKLSGAPIFVFPEENRSDTMTKVSTALLISELDPHQKNIEDNESASIVARWEFGRVLRAQIPQGKKQLPNGVREQVAKHYAVDPTEITRRMQLAREFETRDELMDACTRWGNSWRRIIAEELVKSRQPKATPWSESAKALVDRLLNEASDDGRRDRLVKLLTDALHTLGVDFIEDES